MSSGYIKGALWGAGVGLSTVLLVSLADNRSAPRDFSQELGLNATQQSRTIPERIIPRGDAQQPDMDAPAPDTLAVLLEETFATAGTPEADTVTATPSATLPDAVALSTLSTSPGQAPQVSLDIGGALEAPTIEQDFSISTEPAQPAMPPAVTETAPFETPEIEAMPSAPDEEAVVGLAPAIGADAKDDASPLPVEVEDLTRQTTEQPNAQDSALQIPVAPGDTDQAQVPVRIAVDPTADAPTPSVVPAPQQPQPIEPASSDVADIAAETAAPIVQTPREMSFEAEDDKTTVAGDSEPTRVSAELEVQQPVATAVPDQTTPQPVVLEGMAPVAPADILPPVVAAETTPDPIIAQAAAPPPEVPPSQAPPDTPTVKVNRLPTLGDVPPAAGPEAAEVVAETPDDGASLPPVERFAAAYDAEAGKPLVAVVLMDDGVNLQAETTGVTALQQLPFPVTVAVDALLPDAPARVAAYRSAGLEVLATVDFPAGATAADAEVNLDVVLGNLPEVIGILDGPRSGVQTTPGAGRQTASILAQSGHGFVTQNRGLNTLQKIAARNGVPSAVVFRDFDAEGQNADVIRRFLDQAAFRAGQQGSVVMLGRLRAETIAALMVWTLQDRAATVGMAPASAALATQP